MKDWYRRHRTLLDKVVAVSEDQQETNPASKVNKFSFIEGIHENVETDLMSASSKVYYVNGYLSYIKQDDNTVYEACPVCKKKVTKEGEFYSCEKCATTIEKPNESFLLTGKVSDATGSMFLRFYGA